MEKVTSGPSDEGPSFVEWVRKKYHKELLLIAKALCSRFRFDTAYADDLMQDLYYTVMVKESEVREGVEENDMGYLVKMLKNELINQERKRSATHRRESIFSERKPRIAHIFSLCSDDHLASFYQELEKILPEKDLEIIKLYIEGYSYKEIAQCMEMPIGTVSAKIHRVKSKIAEHFGWCDDEDNGEEENLLF